MSDKKLVWDLPLRLFHWSIGISIIGSWVTIENGYEQIHMYLGYFIIGLLIFRIVWGFIGTRHSQFQNFFPTPSRLLPYLKTVFTDEARKSVGHNPVGSLMVFLMLTLVSLQAASGLFTSGEIWAGPYSSALDSDTTKQIESIHHKLFDAILVLVALHIVAVFGYLLFKKQNLIFPMFTGKKDAEDVPDEEAIKNSKLPAALFLLILVASFVYWLVFVAPPPVVYEYY